MKSGLSHDELAQICAVLETVPSVEKAVLFGSRAMGLARSNSDVDIMLYGNRLTMQDVMQISGLLDETTLPYQFDLIRNDVKKPALLEHVRRYGKVIFQRGRAPLDKLSFGLKREEEVFKLVDLCSKIGSGATPRGGKESYKKSGIALFRSQNILDFKFSTEGLVFIDESQATQLENVVVERDDVLINITGDSVARVCMAPSDKLPARVNQHVAIVRTKPQVADAHFIFYYLQYIKEHLLSLASSGATRNALTKKMLEELIIKLPPLPKQHAIARALSALDEKIANNTAINHHLEQMAQAIFKSWFVSFEPFADGDFVDSELGEIPIGWSVLPVEAIAEKVAMGPFGSNIKVETFVESGVPIISGNHLRRFYLDESEYNFITEEHARRLSNSLVRAGDIIFTHAGNIGQVALIPDDCGYPYYIISQRQFYLRCDRKKAVPEYINYYFHSREGQGKLLANASQTGVPSIARPSSHLKTIVVPIPPVEVQLKWLDTVKPMLQMLNRNSKESKRLAAVRDVLLPRLMSGELSVADLSDAK